MTGVKSRLLPNKGGQYSHMYVKKILIRKDFTHRLQKRSFGVYGIGLIHRDWPFCGGKRLVAIDLISLQ